jgi:hypothetical protein
MTIASWWINTTDSSVPNNTIYEPAAYLHSLFPNLNARGIQGYYYVYPNALQGIFVTEGKDAGASVAKRTWAPLLAALSTYPGMDMPIAEYADVPDYKGFFDRAFGPIESMKDMPGMSGMAENDMSVAEESSTGLLRRGFLKEANDRWYKVYRRHGPAEEEPAAGVDRGPVSFK